MRRSEKLGLVALLTLVLVLGSGVGRAAIVELEGEMRVSIVPQPIALILGGRIEGPYSSGPFVGVAPYSLEFVACCTEVPGGGPVSYEWDFTYDGLVFVPAVSGPGPVIFTYEQAPAERVVALRLTTASGERTIISELVSILNVDPTLEGVTLANAGGPYNGVVGSPVTFTASPDDEFLVLDLVYAWDFDYADEFIPDEIGPELTSPSYTYADPGTYTVALEVSDPDSGVSTLSTTLATILPVTFGAAMDTWIDRSDVSMNHGTATTMNVRSEIGKNHRSLVRFDLSAIPANTPVASATLRVYASGVPLQSRTYRLRRIADDWTETGVTWDTQLSASDVETDTATTPASAGWMTWDVTADVQAAVNGAATHYGWIIQDANEFDINNDTGHTTFNTREHPTEDLRPVLEVHY